MGATINCHQVKAGWGQAELWPMSQTIMGALPSTPGPNNPQILPETPYTSRTLHIINTQVYQGEMTEVQAFEKTRKALESVMAAKVLLEKDLERHRETRKLQDAVDKGGKKPRYPHGELYDQKYAEDNAVQLGARLQAERVAKEQTKRKSRPKQRQSMHALDTAETAGSSKTTQEGLGRDATDG